jgi:hypothetical protein
MTMQPAMQLITCFFQCGEFFKPMNNALANSAAPTKNTTQLKAY